MRETPAGPWPWDGAAASPSQHCTTDVSNAVQRNGNTQACSASRRPDSGVGSLDLVTMVNHRLFGHASFREQQRDIIQSALEGQDTLVLMPTGGGKSLCYQLPAVVGTGLVVVVCPLLSLMQDQVSALVGDAGGGVPTAYLNSTQTKQDTSRVFRELCKPLPTIKLLYVTPEQLVKNGALCNALLDLYDRGLLSRVVVDEAHCVSMWGHDFRKDYKRLGFLRETFPDVPIMALTATATSKVRADILASLNIRGAKVFKTNFYRSNLLLKVLPKEKGYLEDGIPASYQQLLDFINERSPGECGIVYCLTRDESSQVARFLEDVGNVASSCYHAGMTAKQRTQVQHEWRRGAVRVVVATIAFGMGIDKADVRFVVHFTLSKSVEGYYQEAGRAGRDGRAAVCAVLYAPRDCARICQLLRKGFGASKKSDLQLLEVMREYCEQTETCRHKLLLEYFGERMPGNACGCRNKCDVCAGTIVPLNAPEKKGQRATPGGPRKRRKADNRDTSQIESTVPAFQSASTLFKSNNAQPSRTLQSFFSTAPKSRRAKELLSSRSSKINIKCTDTITRNDSKVIILDSQ